MTDPFLDEIERRLREETESHPKAKGLLQTGKPSIGKRESFKEKLTDKFENIEMLIGLAMIGLVIIYASFKLGSGFSSFTADLKKLYSLIFGK